MLPIIVINLDRSPDRMARFSSDCAAAGLAFQRFRGVDGLAIPDHLKPYFCDAGGRIVAPLSSGEIGCFASHLGVWRLVVERGIPAALICEDDALLSSDLADTVSELLSALPADWDIVRLCRAPKRAAHTLALMSTGRRLVQYSKIPSGSAGYLVSKAGAAKLLRQRKAWAPVDVEISHAWDLGLNVYGVMPPPITQDLKASLIGKRVKTSRLRRMMPTPRRLVFNARKMGAAAWARCLALNWTRKLRPPQAISPKTANPKS
jgi:glycosyl transferase family 25